METKTLSPRETEITQLLALGYSDKEISTKLIVSEATIRTHHRNIYRKTNSKNLADVTRWWFQTNFEITLGIPARVKLVFYMLFIALSFEVVLTSFELIRTRTARTITARRGVRSTRKVLELV